MNFSTDIDYEWQDRSRQRAERSCWRKSKTSCPLSHGRAGRSAYTLFLPRRGRNATIIPSQIRNDMDFRVCGRADSVLSQIILTTPAPPNRYPRMHGAASSQEMARCFKAICSTRGSFNGVIPCRAERSPMTTAQGFPITRYEALARVLLPEIQAFFESEDGQREYAEWKAKQQAEQEDKA